MTVSDAIKGSWGRWSGKWQSPIEKTHYSVKFSLFLFRFALQSCVPSLGMCSRPSRPSLHSVLTPGKWRHIQMRTHCLQRKSPTLKKKILAPASLSWLILSILSELATALPENKVLARLSVTCFDKKPKAGKYERSTVMGLIISDVTFWKSRPQLTALRE